MAQDKLKDKALRKECKEKLKQFKEEGWGVYQDSQTLDEALTAFYMKIEACGDSLQQVVGVAEHRNPQMAQRKAFYSAARQCASMKGATIKGGMKTTMTNEATADSTTSKVTHDASYESNVSETVKSLVPELSLSRLRSNGNTEVQLFFLIGDNQ